MIWTSIRLREIGQPAFIGAKNVILVSKTFLFTVCAIKDFQRWVANWCPTSGLGPEAKPAERSFFREFSSMCSCCLDRWEIIKFSLSHSLSFPSWLQPPEALSIILHSTAPQHLFISSDRWKRANERARERKRASYGKRGRPRQDVLQPLSSTSFFER